MTVQSSMMKTKNLFTVEQYLILPKDCGKRKVLENQNTPIITRSVFLNFEGLNSIFFNYLFINIV